MEIYDEVFILRSKYLGVAIVMFIDLFIVLSFLNKNTFSWFSLIPFRCP